MKRTVAIGLVFLALSAAAVRADDLSESIERDFADRLAMLFEHFHRNPELSYLETETAARLAAELREYGVEVTEGVGGTGLVGMLRNGAGPLVLVRADMDGLPIKEDHRVILVGGTPQSDLDAAEAGGPAVPSHHSPLFKIEPHASVTSGVRAMTLAVLELLDAPADRR